jgi:signal transduction histidine kinase/CheY-like chemotaxis protein
LAHILIVDDRPLNRQVLVTLLGYYGHSAEEAGDGASALAQVAARRPDLVITDLLMPNMDGEELCRRLRADPRTASIAIIIHTASYRAPQAKRIADGVGVRWVLPKPSEPADVMAMVSQALGIESVAGRPDRELDVRPLIQQHPGAVLENSQRLARMLTDACELAQTQVLALAAAPATSAASLAPKLASLVNLSLQMARERDPEALADHFCAAAQEILGVRYVGVVLLAPDGSVKKFAAAGLDHVTRAAVAHQIADCPAARRVLGDGREARMIVANKPGDFIGLPAAHPAVRSLLACPVLAHDMVSGWMYAADRQGGEAFDGSDERLLSALGAILATTWASLMVLDDLERRVVERTRALEQANEELDAFSFAVSHDLRSPLGQIDGYVQALRERVGASMPAEAERFLGSIERNVGNMGVLIEDLLHFAKTSRTALTPQAFDLGALLASCLEEFRDEVAARGIAVELGRLGDCYADPALLRQVLLNVLGNAMKYTRNTPRPVIRIDCRQVGGEQLLTIRDNGAGFDMAFAHKMFTPFGRLHSSSEYEGSGIGLALVRQIVHRHGGRVWAEGRLGQGASIFVTLPLPARR